MLSRLATRVIGIDRRRLFSLGTERFNWDVVSAVCLERRPVITKELTDVEKSMLLYFRQVDIEDSLKSDFEVKEDAEATTTTKIVESQAFKKTVVSTASVQSRRDILDLWEKELQEVTLAPRLTQADVNEDVKSVERKLDSRLFLLIRQDGAGDRWLFPHGTCNDGETLRESAERILRDQCGPDLKALFLSNAPCGFFEFKYTKKYREQDGNSVGAKVFFYKAELIDGQVKCSTFQWRTKSELLGIVDKKYAKSLDKFLLNDG